MTYRFSWASTVEREDYERQQLICTAIRRLMAEMLGDGGLLVIPTIPAPAPKKKRTAEEAEHSRASVMQLTCISGLTGFPQVTIPLAGGDGLPIGLSVIANRGQDIRLLTWICGSLREGSAN